MHNALDWPFFDPAHRALAQQLRADLAKLPKPPASSTATLDEECLHWVKTLAQAGYLKYCIGTSQSDTNKSFDLRSFCLLREILAYHSGLADFSFAMQGLGAGAILLHGNQQQKEAYLPRVANGSAIAAFALSEANAGSDAAAMNTQATRDGDNWCLNGEKAWVSNGSIADFYIVFARTDITLGAQGISAFIVDAGTPGLEIAERIDVLAPHPLNRIRLKECRIKATQIIGQAGTGFKIAMQTLDVFRSSVAAAALGFAKKACDTALQYTQSRTLFGRQLADMQLTQARLANMATAIDAAALLTYRAAWLHDQATATHRPAHITREAAMAKLFSTEQAQQVIDSAVQLLGGYGLLSEGICAKLYREIRALRIYEGTSEIQQLVIARDMLKTHPTFAQSN